MLQTAFIEDRHVEPLAEGVLAVLERVGVLCQSETMLQALAAAGAQIDFAAERVRFPRRMVEEYVASWRAETGITPLPTGRFATPPLPNLSGQVAQFYYDDHRGEKRLGNCADFITLTRLGDVLDHHAPVGHALTCADVPAALEPLQACINLVEYAHTPGFVYTFSINQTPYLREMNAIVGEEHYAWPAICFAHPLRFDREVAGRFVHTVRDGNWCGLTAMPVAGVTTPVTIEGFTVVSAAEHTATWICGRVLKPDVPLCGSQWAATVDMRTGQTSYSSPDAMCYAFASIEFLRRWTGVRIPPGSGEYCDARVPGLYAALEKAYKAMSVAAFYGAHPPVGQGMVECGKTISPVQLLLDREIVAALRAYDQRLDPTAERIAVPTILEVDLGTSTSYLEADHTREHFRDCLWLPEIWDRSGYNGIEAERAILHHARERVASLLAEYVKPEGREDQLVALRQVLAKARGDLVG